MTKDNKSKKCIGCGKSIKWYQRIEKYDDDFFHKGHIPWSGMGVGTD